MVEAVSDSQSKTSTYWRVLDSGRVRVRVGVRVWSLGGRGRAKREVVAGAPQQQRQTKWRCRRGISGGVTDMKMRNVKFAVHRQRLMVAVISLRAIRDPIRV